MYQAGWSRKEIGIEPRGYAMFGYGMWTHRARGKQTGLFARAFHLRDARGGRPLIFCCLDLGYISHAMREGVVAALRERFGADFDESTLVMCCTHTHSGPGGCSHEAMYNIVTPGFVPQHLEAIVKATVDAIVEAAEKAAPTELALTQGAFDEDIPVAWNRSLRAYNRNPDVTPRLDTETHLAINRGMQVLSFRRDGQVRAFISIFGVHATCLGNKLERHDADNKGYAAVEAEQALSRGGVLDGVAIFAQATAGDVSPHFQGPGDIERRARIKGDAEYAYARQNGHHQCERALSLLGNTVRTRVDGAIDSILAYFDFSAIKADPAYANGQQDAWTSEPCHGVAFFRGTRVDGVGMPAIAGVAARFIARMVRRKRLRNLAKYSPEDQAYYQRLYAAQGPKDILLESGPRHQILGNDVAKLPLPDFVDPTIREMKRQARIGAIKDSELVPTVLPLQIVVLGPLAIVCCPGEFTTTSGQRLVQGVRERLRARGVEQVLICTYCNDYMGYVTTNEEYQEQCYEGGHTIFGQWTLAAFQTGFAELAMQLLKPEAERTHDRALRPKPVPAAELALRTDLKVPG